MPIRIASPAKINISLRIKRQRGDGYHVLDSVLLFAELCDHITLRASNRDSTDWDGITLAGNATSIDAARHLFRTTTGWQQPLAIHIKKAIPIAAGLGGGSGNGAAVLEGMRRLCDSTIPAKTMATMAIKLGADVPAQLHAWHSPSLWHIQGIGEIVTRLEFAEYKESPMHAGIGILLANPGIPLATPDVFAAYQQNKGRANNNKNDLLAAATHLAPALADFLAQLQTLAAKHNCVACGLSGSGATCFALFASVAQAQAAADAGQSDMLKNAWHWAGGIFKPGV